MSYHFIDKKDPRIDVMFQGLEKMERMLSVMEDVPRSLFNGERFLTDEELSKVLRVSRRTLQEYRTFGVIPYYLVQGKALYKESDIMKILDDAYKRCREEQRWVEYCFFNQARRNCLLSAGQFLRFPFHTAGDFIFRFFLTVKSSSQRSILFPKPVDLNRFMSSSTFVSVTCA